MLLTELEDLVLDLSGEFILGGIEVLQFSHDRFYRLVTRCMGIYEKHRPYEVVFNLDLSQVDYVFSASVAPGIPDWVSAIIPLGVPVSPFGNLRGSSESNPGTFLWRYDKPNLYLTETGRFEVTALFPYKAEVTKVDGKITEVDYPDFLLSEHEFFVDLLLGNFMVSVGRSRRAFTVQDLPVVMDADSLVSEGKERIVETLERLEERSKWWLAIPAV